MNNANGAELFRRVHNGARVTIRNAEGARVSGIALKTPSGPYRLRIVGETFGEHITPGNILEVRP